MADLKTNGPEGAIEGGGTDPEDDFWERHARDYHIDYYLASLVKMANTGGFEVSITLSSGGRLITGTLTSGRRYFQDINEQMVKSVPEAHEGFFRDLFQEMSDGYPDPEKLDQREEMEKLRPPGYVHLRDARILQDGGPAILCEHWRGKLIAVVGFFLGHIPVD
jgi:hypothetical protein